MNEENNIWHKRFQHLRMKLLDLNEEVEWKFNEFAVSTKRELAQAKRLYVNFDLETCDNKKYANENWGEGNYDVYDLNETLSPKDEG